jgi:hypothetical protein
MSAGSSYARWLALDVASLAVRGTVNAARRGMRLPSVRSSSFRWGVEGPAAVEGTAAGPGAPSMSAARVPESALANGVAPRGSDLAEAAPAVRPGVAPVDARTAVAPYVSPLRAGEVAIVPAVVAVGPASPSAAAGTPGPTAPNPRRPVPPVLAAGLNVSTGLRGAGRDWAPRAGVRVGPTLRAAVRGALHLHSP